MTDATAARGCVRPVLWLLLLTSAVAGIGFGLLTLAFGAALVIHHYRHRRG